MTVFDELSQSLEQYLRILIMLQFYNGVLLAFEFGLALVQLLAYYR